MRDEVGSVWLIDGSAGVWALCSCVWTYIWTDRQGWIFVAISRVSCNSEVVSAVDMFHGGAGLDTPCELCVSLGWKVSDIGWLVSAETLMKRPSSQSPPALATTTRGVGFEVEERVDTLAQAQRAPLASFVGCQGNISNAASVGHRPSNSWLSITTLQPVVKNDLVLLTYLLYREAV